jgi:predicted Rossmann fold nucleotide-binding protein DprA/Smf involved in DNA uptake
MTEIAQLLESALKNNRSNLLRRAAMATVAKLPGSTTLRELLDSDAGTAVRGLTLNELAEALRGGPSRGEVAARSEPAPAAVSARTPAAATAGASEEERIFRSILEAVQDEPLTIGQLSKQLQLDSTALRGYLTWMKRVGKIESHGKARATRYSAPGRGP